ncbi:MAG TPA: suppressor of fused domain protein [Chloroflexia bacterium]|nr:suppressor of fused domain protein [Chloroflexia bacterium]
MSEKYDSPLELKRFTSKEEFDLLDKRDWELVAHYADNTGGEAKGYYQAIDLPPYIPGPLYVLELWRDVLGGRGVIYLTCGASRQPMPNAPHETRIELMTYAREPNIKIATFLAGLGMYPFKYNTFLDFNHTMEFPDGKGIIDNSPLTAAIFVPPFIEAKSKELRTMKFKDGSHAHILWYLPVYPAERHYFKTNGGKLFTKFAENGVDIADYFRRPVDTAL